MRKKTSKNGKKSRSKSRDEDVDVDTDAADGESKSRRTTIPYEDFVKAWRDATGVKDVADAFNIKTTSASALANRLRKAGVVELKRFPRRGSREIDVKKLNRIAAGKD